ncbi:MAG TPA: magnesium/cobalt transporter CorA [Thermomicrobiales bacterium]|jgi:magnesium transporter|nr:magnesium/cobalt transporter CorA [Thermomicrobiales bacterium]
MIIDSAIYVNGSRQDAPSSIRDSLSVCEATDGIAWIGMYQPSAYEFGTVTEEFGLHELAIEDAVRAHQRPKIERYGNTLFVVLRAARYLDASETVSFSELHVFIGQRFVITVRHGMAPDLGRVRRRMESDPDILRMGPQAILYAILDRVVDDYAPVVAGLEKDIEQIEVQVFGGEQDVTRRTYELAREVIEFQRAIKPISGIVAALIAGAEKYGMDIELQRYLRDVQDHAIQVQDQVAGFRELLQNILNVNLAIVGLRQNEEVKALTEASIHQGDEVKKISAWAAVLFAPTLIGTVYGMNFDHMPELHWTWGYPLSLLMMVVTGFVLYLVFRSRGWLS